jgi:predicted phosphodiesterase
MRTLIISDIHANYTALEAVLLDAEGFDRVWCLGDVVGYGPDPNQCIDRLRCLPNLECIKGNHDSAIIGDIDLAAFNFDARTSLEWLRKNLTEDNKNWLGTLKEQFEIEDFTLVHGSPRSPVWEYVMDLYTARLNMAYFSTQFCLVGHTHMPCVFQMDSDRPESTRLYFMAIDQEITLDRKAIVNPGSVGQPRDHDPRASYLIYDDEENHWLYRRVEYDIGQVQDRIRAAGLPNNHAARLEAGW